MLTFMDDAVGWGVLLFLQVVSISGLIWYGLDGRTKRMNAKWTGGWVARLAVSELGQALFLRRALSRTFRLHLCLLMGVCGHRYQQDQLFFVRVLAAGFRLALGKTNGGVPTKQELHQCFLYLLNREFPNRTCNEAVTAFMLRGLTQWDVELLFWLNIGWPEHGNDNTAQV